MGEIISRFEKRGFQLRALKVINVTADLAEKHYADLSSKPFFRGLVSSSGVMQQTKCNSCMVPTCHAGSALNCCHSQYICDVTVLAG